MVRTISKKKFLIIVVLGFNPLRLKPYVFRSLDPATHGPIMLICISVASPYNQGEYIKVLVIKNGK